MHDLPCLKSLAVVRNPYNRYYVPRRSPWPVLLAWSVGGLCFTLVLWFHRKINFYFFLLPLVSLFRRLVCWWRDLIKERYMGVFTRFVIKTYRDGVFFFICREAIIFFSFFWAFFHSRWSPSTNLDMMWPPLGVRCPKPFRTALFRTSLLIRRRVFCV